MRRNVTDEMSGEGRTPGVTVGEQCAHFGDMPEELAEPDVPVAAVLVVRGLVLPVTKSGWPAGRSTNERHARGEG